MTLIFVYNQQPFDLSGAGPGFQNRGAEGVIFGRRPELIAPQARNPRRGVWRRLPQKTLNSRCAEMRFPSICGALYPYLIAHVLLINTFFVGLRNIGGGGRGPFGPLWIRPCLQSTKHSYNKLILFLNIDFPLYRGERAVFSQHSYLGC